MKTETYYQTKPAYVDGSYKGWFWLAVFQGRVLDYGLAEDTEAKTKRIHAATLAQQKACTLLEEAKAHING